MVITIAGLVNAWLNRRGTSSRNTSHADDEDFGVEIMGKRPEPSVRPWSILLKKSRGDFYP